MSTPEQTINVTYRDEEDRVHTLTVYPPKDRGGQTYLIVDLCGRTERSRYVDGLEDVRVALTDTLYEAGSLWCILFE